MNPTLRKMLLITAEVTLVLVILALIAANWIPVVIGAHPVPGKSTQSSSN